MLIAIHVLVVVVMALIFGAIGVAFGLLQLATRPPHPLMLAAPSGGGVAGAAMAWTLSKGWFTPVLGVAVPMPVWITLFALAAVIGAVCARLVKLRTAPAGGQR